MIRAAVIDTGLAYARHCYRSTAELDFSFIAAHSTHASALHEHDWIAVPNGCDHIALWRARGAVAEVLERGGVLVCGDGWFTDWVPGNRWIHDNSQPTAAVRYRIRSDRHGLLQASTSNDALTQWLCNERPAGPFTVERRWYAVRNFGASAE